MSHGDLALYALDGDYGRRIASHLGVPVAEHEERSFEDGEHKARPLEPVRDRDAFVIGSLHGDRTASVNDKLVRLLLFLSTLRDAHAARVTAVIPYLAYARKDRRTRFNDPVATRYVAQLIEAAGANAVMLLDVHNPAAVENAFRIPVDHIEARPLFVRELVREMAGVTPVVVSPDTGGYKRAERLRGSLALRLGVEPPMAFMEKRRSDEGLAGDTLVGDVRDRLVVLVDDLISTGATLARAATACENHGAAGIHAVATHGLFTGDAWRTLAATPIRRLTVTDTVRPEAGAAMPLEERLVVLDSSHLLAEAIRRAHRGESVTDPIDSH